MWNDLENKIILYADDKNFYTEVASPSGCINVDNSLNKDLVKIQLWCSTWGMKLNLCKTQLITISRSRKLHPLLTLCGFDLEVSIFKLLEVTLDNKLIFEKHICKFASSIAKKIGLIRKCYKTSNNNDTTLKSFYVFILPCFKYCSP